MRLAVIEAQYQANRQQTKRRILQKQEEWSKRHDANLEEIRKKAFEMSDASISSAENIVFVELVFNLASASNWDSASTRTSVFDWNDVKNKFWKAPSNIFAISNVAMNTALKTSN